MKIKKNSRLTGEDAEYFLKTHPELSSTLRYSSTDVNRYFELPDKRIVRALVIDKTVDAAYHLATSLSDLPRIHIDQILKSAAHILEIRRQGEEQFKEEYPEMDRDLWIGKKDIGRLEYKTHPRYQTELINSDALAFLADVQPINAGYKPPSGMVIVSKNSSHSFREFVDRDGVVYTTSVYYPFKDNPDILTIKIAQVFKGAEDARQYWDELSTLLDFQKGRHVLYKITRDSPDFPNHLPEWKATISSELQIDLNQLEGSRNSLKLIDKQRKKRKVPMKHFEKTLYGPVFGYIGEVLRTQLGGQWHMQPAKTDAGVWEPFIVLPDGEKISWFIEMADWWDDNSYRNFSAESVALIVADLK